MKRFFLVSFIAISILLPGCGEKAAPGSVEPRRKEITGVSVTEAAKRQYPDITEVPATIKARNISTVSARIMGTVSSIRVREGDRVKKGALLLTISSMETMEREKGAEAALLEARKGLEAARERRGLTEATYGRYKGLYEEKALSQQEFDQVASQRNEARLEAERMEAALRRAEAGAAEARVFGSYTRVTSPVNGVVTAKKIEVGSMASPGVPLAVVEDDSGYSIEADVDERLFRNIKPGMVLKASVPSLGAEFDAKVTGAAPSIDPRSRTFFLKASIKGAGLKTGLYAVLNVPSGERTAVTVPAAAIVSKGQLTGAYVVDDKGNVTYRLVRTGSAFGKDVEVLSGISPGEKVISSGAEKAFDNGILRNR